MQQEFRTSESDMVAGQTLINAIAMRALDAPAEERLSVVEHAGNKYFESLKRQYPTMEDSTAYGYVGLLFSVVFGRLAEIEASGGGRTGSA